MEFACCRTTCAFCLRPFAVTRPDKRVQVTFGFIPVRSSIRILSLGSNAMIDELIQRVDQTRQ